MHFLFFNIKVYKRQSENIYVIFTSCDKYRSLYTYSYFNMHIHYRVSIFIILLYVPIICTYVTQYNKRYILSTFEKIEIFALSNRRFNKLSNDTKFIKIEVMLLKIQVLQSVNYLLFYTLFCLLSQNNVWPTRCPFCCTGSHI